MASTNYGITLARETTTPGTYASIGEVVSSDLPAYLTDALETTNHGSAGLKTFVTSGLKGMDLITVTLNCDASLITLVKTDMRAKTISNFKFTGVGDFTSFIFQAFFTSFQISNADATNPSVIQAVITLQPTGSLTVA